MATHSRIQSVEGSKQVIQHKAISLWISVCGQRELAPYAARTWRPTHGSKSPKGQRKDSGVTAVRLPSDKSPDDIPKAPAAKHSTVSDDIPVTRKVFEKEESLSSGPRSSCCSLPGLPHHPGKICFAAGSLFSRDEWLSRPSHRPGPGLPPSQTLFCFAADSLFSRDECLSLPAHHPGSGLPPSPTLFF